MSSSRKISRLLVVNRGEIAARILSAARELGIETFAVYTENDASHTYHAAHSIKLSSPAAYLDIKELVSIAKKNRIDAVHPGYGFLSESAELARCMMDEAGVLVVGPGADVLDRTGDKLQARLLAQECQVPVLPALTTPTNDIKTVEAFAKQAGLPIMIKAVDGGGGRGIRLATRDVDLAGAMTRAVEESPSHQVFAEKAAVTGFRHIEIQIVGDGHGNVTHLWERECSIQRRYQKVIEQAPSTVKDRKLVAKVIEAALQMAKRINYTSLGTFEFLVNPTTSEYYFLEINPRLQVEHTVTESICLTDIVTAQLLLAQGVPLTECGLQRANDDPIHSPALHSLQLRITAEDPSKNWTLSVGKIQSFHFPSGNGVRIDTHLVSGAAAVVSADFDSLIAKLVITAPTWPSVLQKAKRALDDTRIVGVQTNLAMLRAIVSHQDFVEGSCDTQWLEKTHDELLTMAASGSAHASKDIFAASTPSSSAIALASSSTLFRKDDAWTLTLDPTRSGKMTNLGSPHGPSPPYHLQVSKILRNDFPTSLSAEITFTSPSSEPQAYKLQMQSTSASASGLASQRRQGSTTNPSHVVVPFSGRLVEFCVDVGQTLQQGDVVCVVKQMKMELEVRAARRGIVTWITEAEDGEDVVDGMLAAVIEEEGRVEAKL